jgi:anaerobic selenocysteine-containing dehydrogenase
VQMGRQALPLPGETKPDWWITQEIGRRIGMKWNYAHPRDIYTEMASLMPSLDNIPWQRVEDESAVTYPSDALDQPGHDVVFDKGFPRPGGFGKLVAAKLTPPNETPDHDFTARHGRAQFAPGRRHPRRRGVHPLRLLRGGRQQAHQPGARPVRQDPRIQVLRRARGGGRPATRGRGVGHDRLLNPFVPAQAGTQCWIPACAGMSGCVETSAVMTRLGWAVLR